MVEAKIQILKKGLKQKQLAAACGVSEQFVGRCLNGQRRLPRRHALRIKSKYNIPIKSWYTKAA